MQTALSVRESVMKVLDVFVFVIVYFLSALALVASADWRLTLPLILWAVVYGCIMWWYVPRLGKVAEDQADARSVMTGRIVDSYTNIQTVKLFAHAGREEDYARESMDGFLQTRLNALVAFSQQGFERRDHIADDVFRAVMQQGRQALLWCQVRLQGAADLFHKDRMFGH